MLTAIGILALLVLAVVLVDRATDFAAHVSRHRAYRKAYPAASFGRVWRHTR